MSTSIRPSDFVRRTLALTAILSASVMVASAQTSPVNSGATSSAAPALNMQLPAIDTSSDSLFSSSSDTSAGTDIASNTDNFHFVNAMQYNGRYGKPRYRGGNTNQDGSPKWAFLAGAGFTVPFTTDSSYLTPNWGLQVGGGRNFNKLLGVLLQFDYDHFGMTGQTINNQAARYFNDPTNSLYGIGGNSHIWSFTLNPTITLKSGEGLGAYAVVGGGFYHKEATFFAPQVATECDFYGCFQYQANATIQNFTSNAVGANGGIGLTYKPSRFAGERLYAEVRLVHVFNQYKPGVTSYAQSLTSNSWNYFPENSQATTYLPVKFGIRF